jgi:WD40 repeat protein
MKPSRRTVQASSNQNPLLLSLLFISLVLFLHPLTANAAGIFGTPGSMNAARGAHTATTLLDGTVLLVCGQNTGNSLSSAELYNPITKKFTPTGSMNETGGREQCTATLLLSGPLKGQVLIAGGSGNGYYRSAELYNPITKKFTTTGSMNEARYTHTATLLPSGKVLIAGGGGNGVFSNTAELYDPTTGQFTYTGPMKAARGNHTATLLLSGKVLIAGGATISTGALKSAELYDPIAKKFTSTVPMNAARQAHTATLLLSGKVLVAGGADVNNSNALKSAELYDPNTQLFKYTGSMNAARNGHTATLLNIGSGPSNGKVLVAGGYQLNSAELYDPQTTQWKYTDSMNDARSGHTATLLLTPVGNFVLVAGGGIPNAVWKSAELYFP